MVPYVIAMGMGVRLLGVLGASLGFGIHQAMQVASSQTVGVVAGEWHGVLAKPRRQMVAAMLLLVAVVLFAAGKRWTSGRSGIQDRLQTNAR